MRIILVLLVSGCLGLGATSPRPLEPINIRRDFGVTGTGIDETAKIQAAIDSLDPNLGGKIYFPPAKYAAEGLVIRGDNVTLEFDSWSMNTSAQTNYITDVGHSAPVLIVGTTTNLVKGFTLINGYFKGDETNGVGIRLVNSSRAHLNGTKVSGFKTNQWWQAAGSGQVSENRWFQGSCQAANVENSRGLFVAAPDSGTGFTVRNYLIGCEMLSQVGMTNTSPLEMDGADIWDIAGSYGLLTNSAIIVSMTAGVNVFTPVLRCVGTSIDGSSTFPAIKDNYGASERGSAMIQGYYTFNGQGMMQSGKILAEEVMQSALDLSGHIYNPFLRGEVKFMGVTGDTTNRTWQRIFTQDDDRYNLWIMNTNGTLSLMGNTNINFGVISNTPLMYVQPGKVVVTNSARLWVFGPGSGVYSDSSTMPIVRIFAGATSNQVTSVLHLDSYQNTPAFPISLDFGLMNSTNGDFTSQIIHFANVNTNQGSELLMRTHSVSNGIWNTGFKQMNNGWFGFGKTNPATFMDINGDTMIRGTNFGVRSISYAWPAANGAGALFNDGAGSLTWQSIGLTNFSVGNMTNWFTVSGATNFPLLSVTSPGANRIAGFDNTDARPVWMTFAGDGVSYDHASHTLTFTGGTNTSTNGGITSLNGSTNAVQSFNTGEAGSDFNIATTNGVHTFNLPIADATHTGKLTAADWQTFSDKQPVLNFDVGTTNSGGTVFGNYYPGTNIVAITNGTRVTFNAVVPTNVVRKTWYTKSLDANLPTSLLTCTPIGNMTAFGATIHGIATAKNASEIYVTYFEMYLTVKRIDASGGVFGQANLVELENSLSNPVFQISDNGGTYTGATSCIVELATIETFGSTSITVQYYVEQYGDGTITLAP